MRTFIGRIVKFKYTTEVISGMSSEVYLRTEYLREVFKLFNSRLENFISFLEFLVFYTQGDALFYSFGVDIKTTIYYTSNGQCYRFQFTDVQRVSTESVTIKRLKFLERCFQETCIEYVGEEFVKEEQELFNRYNFTFCNKFIAYTQMVLANQKNQWE